MPPIWRRIEGRSGRIEVELLGSQVGALASWTLTRRSDTGPEAEFYDLHAICSYVTKGVFEDPSYTKSVILQIGGKNGRPYRLIPSDGPGQRTVLSGRSLIMERVTLVAA